ncbi:MAG TPA: HPr-rel-A system PqqD family peptide chaperone [Polyangia bacterium]|jgi:PqqD family protein of HPr-rel-A system|nr:HPr-rel-A system PqqD family peptide chaperone [Polyangia bacterium]
MTYKRDPGVPFQKLDEETIVVDPRTREVHLLNDTAARIWELLASSRSVDELTAALGEEYDAPAEELRASVEELLGGLGDKGLLAGSGARQRA